MPGIINAFYDQCLARIVGSAATRKCLDCRIEGLAGSSLANELVVKVEMQLVVRVKHVAVKYTIVWGGHYLYNATCLIRPHLDASIFSVSCAAPLIVYFGKYTRSYINIIVISYYHYYHYHMLCIIIIIVVLMTSTITRITSQLGTILALLVT